MLFHQQLLEGTLNRSKKHIRKCSDSFSVAAEEEEILDKEEFTEKGRVYYQVLQKPDNSLNFYLNFYDFISISFKFSNIIR